MAVAEAKITARAQCYMVSRGPGATNGSIAVHLAQQDAVPLVVLIGQVSRQERGRGAFQEVDYSHFFGAMAKAVFEVSEAGKIAEVLVRAFHLAEWARRDRLSSRCRKMFSRRPSAALCPNPCRSRAGPPSREDAAAVAVLLREGGTAPAGRRRASSRRRAEQKRCSALPKRIRCRWRSAGKTRTFSTMLRRSMQDIWGSAARPSSRSSWSARILVIAAGTRLGDVASLNFTFPRAPEPEQPLIHIYPDPGADRGVVPHASLGSSPIRSRSSILCRRAPPGMKYCRESWCQEIAAFVAEFMRFTSPQPEDGVDFGGGGDGACGTRAQRCGSFDRCGQYVDLGAPALEDEPEQSAARRDRRHDGLRRACRRGGGAGSRWPNGHRLCRRRRDIDDRTGTGHRHAIWRKAEDRHFGQWHLWHDPAAPGAIFPQAASQAPISKIRISANGHDPSAPMWSPSTRGDDIKAKLSAALDFDGASVIHVKSSAEAISAYTTLSALRT